jgi:hypothetical protein
VGPSERSAIRHGNARLVERSEVQFSAGGNEVAPQARDSLFLPAPLYYPLLGRTPVRPFVLWRSPFSVERVKGRSPFLRRRGSEILSGR